MSENDRIDDQELEQLLLQELEPLEASRELYIRPPKPALVKQTPPVLCPGRDVMAAGTLFAACLAVLATGRIPVVEEIVC